MCLSFLHRDFQHEEQQKVKNKNHSVIAEDSILTTLRTGVVVHGPDSSIWYSNPRACELLGMTEDQMYGRTALDPDWHFVDEEGNPLSVDKFPISQVLTTMRELENQTLGIVSPMHSEIVWVLVNATPYFDEKGGLKHVSVNFYDVSKQKTLELEQRKEAYRHQMLLRSASDGLCVLNADGIVQEASDSWCNMIGYSRKQSIGMHVSQWDAQFNRDELVMVLAKIIGAGKRTQFETLHKRSDGSVVPVEVSTMPVDIEGETLIYCSTRDISERKQVEQERLNRQAELERLVTQRTQELNASKELAEAANVTKSAFLANMSHEIRTPLNLVVGLTHIMREQGLPAKQAERLNKIESATEHLLEIINAILDLSKIEAGKLELKEAPISIHRVLDDVINMTKPHAAQKGLSIFSECADIPELLGDATRLRQALLNFTSNAVKFTNKGKIAVRVQVLEESQNIVCLRFEIQDTGIGLATEDIPKLFDEFEQADNSLTRKYSGTGLGLAISKKIAELMEGSVGAESKLGIGSTFWFTVKLKKAGTDNISITASGLTNPMEELTLNYAGKQVLIVDDEPMNRELFAELIEMAGLQSKTAGDGEEAIEAVYQNCFDIILMDMQMPRLHGPEATKRIRELANGKHVPIIALTGNAFADNKELCLASGMNDFLAKPFKPKALYQLLLNWLSV